MLAEGGAPIAFASSAPLPEATSATAGAQTQAARGDHVHPRLTSTTVQSTAADGTATIVFTRTFPIAKKPGVVLTAYDANAQPITFQVTAFQTDAGVNNYTGCTIKAYRSQTIPQNLATLLLGAVFNLFGGTVGVTEFSCVAIMASN